MRNETQERMKEIKKMLDNEFKKYSKAKADGERKFHLDNIQTMALSLKFTAGELESEI